VTVRYLAQTDDTPVGQMALAYLKGILQARVAPVRLVSIAGPLQDGPWMHYASLLVTPMVPGGYVNVVCCSPARWVWEQRTPMTRRLPDGNVAIETATQWRELYTQGVRNVLLTNAPLPLPERQQQTTHWARWATAQRYEALVVPDARLHQVWSVVHPEVALIPTPVTDARSLGAVLLGKEI
jgi:hypothetical protein